MDGCDDAMHNLLVFVVDLIEHVRDVRWLTDHGNWIRKLEVKCSVSCSPVKKFCWWTLQGSLVGGVVGRYGNVYVLIPLPLVGTNVNLEKGYQLPMSLLYNAYCLCVFDGCVLNANSSLFHCSFQKIGRERYVFVPEYYVRNVRVSSEDQYQAFQDQYALGRLRGIANIYFENKSTAVTFYVKPLKGGSTPTKSIFDRSSGQLLGS